MDRTEIQTQELAGDQCCLLPEDEVGFVYGLKKNIQFAGTDRTVDIHLNPKKEQHISLSFYGERETSGKIMSCF